MSLPKDFRLGMKRRIKNLIQFLAIKLELWGYRLCAICDVIGAKSYVIRMYDARVYAGQWGNDNNDKLFQVAQNRYPHLEFFPYQFRPHSMIKATTGWPSLRNRRCRI